MNNIINETFTKHLGLLQQHLKPVMKEGKMNQLSMDLKELSDEEFKRKHGKTKSEIRSLLNVKEGKMNQLSMDLKELSDEEFKRKHGKTKSEIKSMLATNEAMANDSVDQFTLTHLEKIESRIKALNKLIYNHNTAVLPIEVKQRLKTDLKNLLDGMLVMINKK